MAQELVRDPVHGFIELESYELQLIDTYPFQRLRHIRQLGLTSYVYPGAEHTRFQHSLGVCHLGGKALDVLGRQSLFLRALGGRRELKRWRRVFRAACLLHDVGHPPFSHASEGLLPDGLSHDDMGRRVLESHDGMSDILERAHVEPADVAAVMGGDPLNRDCAVPVLLLRALLSGHLGVDRMDYLLRDSLFCGVRYGVFDVDRLINCLVVYENEEAEGPAIGVREGGVHAAEGLLLARYYMFTQVYFHKVRRAYDIALTELMKKLLPDGRFPAEVCEYLKWDDRLVWARLSRSKSQWARSIRKRDHLKMADTTGEHPRTEELQLFRIAVDQLRRELPSVRLWRDMAEANVYAPSPPDEVGVVPDTGQMKRRAWALGQKSMPLQNISPVKTERLYCRPSDLKRVRSLLKRIKNKQRRALDHDREP